MGVLSDFRRSVDALERIATALSSSLRAAHENRLPLERLDELERSRILWEAEAEGLLQKAEGKLKAAANAEARTRTMARNYESDADPFVDDREEVAAPLPEGDAPVSDPEGMHFLPVGVAPESKKQYALRHKFS